MGMMKRLIDCQQYAARMYFAKSKLSDKQKENTRPVLPGGLNAYCSAVAMASNCASVKFFSAGRKLIMPLMAFLISVALLPSFWELAKAPWQPAQLA